MQNRILNLNNTTLVFTKTDDRKKNQHQYKKKTFIARNFTVAFCIFIASKNEETLHYCTASFVLFKNPNPLSESEELQSGGFSEFLLSILMRFDGHF